ncbi:hypothetical protein KEM56_004306 [Ascosphaera pollenicola]|nr:hypothetical protein KEM56_004306 [Ascosphaera pollenicola]
MSSPTASSNKDGILYHPNVIKPFTVPDGYGGAGAMSLELPLPLPSIKKKTKLPCATVTVAETFAFAFDVDGVLSRGKQAIPEAIEALKALHGQNEYGIHVPFVVVTNGGGTTEEQRCKELSSLLETAIAPAQFICSHTPMKQLAREHRTVLVVGLDPERCRHVALSYGFQDVLTTHDFIRSDPSIAPFKSLSKEEYVKAVHRSLASIVIDAILVLSSSRDWGADQQIILDLSMSQGGRHGTRSQTFDEGPALYFAHEDVVWSTDKAFPRIGLGAFKRSLQEIFRALTAKHLPITVFGKPENVIFQCAERTLRDFRRERYGLVAAPDTVYFVGDSPGSDVRGTNAYHDSGRCESAWRPILVETGIYEAGTEPEHKPFRVVANVLEAVKMALKIEQGRLEAGWERRRMSGYSQRISRISEKSFA